MDAWSLRENPRPDVGVTRMRSLGGHIHVSFPLDDPEDVWARVHQVRAMDLLLGVPSILLDNNKERRQLYGKAGAHRMKFVSNGDPYNGVEYRTLSNFWLKRDEYLLWVYDQTMNAVAFAKNVGDMIASEQNRIVQCINEGNEALAKQLVADYHIRLPT
jgi:hypothetical protein